MDSEPEYVGVNVAEAQSSSALTLIIYLNYEISDTRKHTSVIQANKRGMANPNSMLIK